MTKKLVLTYSALFLFAFTFAFAFAMEAQAHDPYRECCIVSMCPPPSVEVQASGHWIPNPDKDGDDEICGNPGGHICDWTINCGPIS